MQRYKKYVPTPNYQHFYYEFILMDNNKTLFLSARYDIVYAAQQRSVDGIAPLRY